MLLSSLSMHSPPSRNPIVRTEALILCTTRFNAGGTLATPKFPYA